MKKKLTAVFAGACLVLCLVPSVCMSFAKSDTLIGNEMAVSFPQMADEKGNFNFAVLGDMGNWFEKHFAFRPQLITADAKIQSDIFRTSNTDTVVTGKNGWLYYASTLDDYLGKNVLTKRGKWALAHNLGLIQDYVEASGAKFLFLVPPNKNTLYGENMPYYYKTPDDADANRNGLAGSLAEEGVSYLDLFALFQAEEETLYLKQDSHWNNKGALLVYDAALSSLGKAHEDYSDVPVTRADTHRGDLSAMIFPAENAPERDYTYEYDQDFTYLITAKSMSDTVSVEDYHIETENPEADGSLLMYRDSFGNTLIPFMANAFEKSVFSKSVPYNLAGDLAAYSPGYVIVEKVERNLADFVKEPAVIPAPFAAVTAQELEEIPEAEISAEQCMANMLYAAVRGTLPDGCVKTDGRIFLGVADAGGQEVLYETFATVSEEAENAFLAYLPMGQFGDPANINTEMFKIYRER